MTKEEQICRPINGFMICNCVMRKGVCVPTKSGKNYKFPIRNWKRRRRLEKATLEVAEKRENETAPTSPKK